MATLLYDTIFPYLGDVFGKLAMVASIDVDLFLELFFGDQDLAVQYLNIFNGQEAIWQFNNVFLNELIPFDTVLRGLFTPYLSMPVWVALLTMSCSIFIGFYAVKFLLR